MKGDSIMTKSGTLLLTGLFLGLGNLGGVLIAGEKTTIQQDINVSQVVTEGWLNLIDMGRYGESWDKGSLMFKNTIKHDEWIKMMEKVRKPLGGLENRAILDIRTAKDPKGLPAGDYMVYVYKTNYSNKKEANELITLVKESDGEWRVLTYQVD